MTGRGHNPEFSVHLLKRVAASARAPIDVPEMCQALRVLYGREPTTDEVTKAQVTIRGEWVIVSTPQLRTVMTVPEVARELTRRSMPFSEDKVRELAAAGHFDGDDAKGIPGAMRTHVGGHWRIPWASVESWLERIRPKVKRR